MVSERQANAGLVPYQAQRYGKARGLRGDCLRASVSRRFPNPVCALCGSRSRLVSHLLGVCGGCIRTAGLSNVRIGNRNLLSYDY